jgi:transcriptional regulator GlxA family with amidase domain
MTMPASATNEIGIVLYPGVQVAPCPRSYGFVRNRRWHCTRSPARRSIPGSRYALATCRDAKLSCVFDSNPRGSPQPRILIIPPTMVDLTNPSVPAGVASWPRSHYASGAKLVSVCSGAFILAETGLVAGRSVSTHRVCAEALAKRFPEIYVDTKQRIIDDGDRSGSRFREPHSMPRGDKPCPTAYRPC